MWYDIYNDCMCQGFFGELRKTCETLSQESRVVEENNV